MKVRQLRITMTIRKKRRRWWKFLPSFLLSHSNCPSPFEKVASLLRLELFHRHVFCPRRSPRDREPVLMLIFQPLPFLRRQNLALRRTKLYHNRLVTLCSEVSLSQLSLQNGVCVRGEREKKERKRSISPKKKIIKKKNRIRRTGQNGND